MQLTELQTFLAIIDTGSLVKASKQLNVTQSTVTARLKSLEDELGQTLIIRQKSGASLTGAGERLRRYAGTISDLWRQARQEISLPDTMSVVCNICCHADLWPKLGSDLFEYIRKNYPQVAISIWLGSEAEMARWLNDGLSDVSLTFSPSASQTQVSQSITTDKLVLVSTSSDFPVKHDPGYVFVEAGEEFGMAHAVAYADAGSSRISFGNAQLGLEYIVRQGGSAYLPERLTSSHLEAGKLYRNADAPEFEREVFMLANRAAISSWPWFEDVENFFKNHR
ncbi:MAG: LysR family transcriptional regulator [Rhizobiaceae bacterium]